MKRRHVLMALTTVAAMPWAVRRVVQPPISAKPTIFYSQAGELQVALAAEPASLRIAGRSATLMTYNQQIPGPRLEVKPGDRLQIHFTNRLSEPTNLHFHGLHIPPTGLGDDPFRTISPGETAIYDFRIPDDHPSGLFWYHPHYHGLVAQQVFSGLSGLLVIRGPLDALPEVQTAQETFLVLQDFDLNRQGQVQEPMPMFRRWGREGALVTVNGQAAPVLALPQGRSLRLRLLNASASRVYHLQLDNHPWWLMATDGGPLAALVEPGAVLLAPGERVDLLVQNQAEPGIYSLLDRPYNRGIMGMAGPMGHGHGRGMMRSAAESPRLIAQIRDPGAISPAALPATLGTVDPLPEPDLVREFVLDHGIDPETGDPFLINGRAFGHHRVDTQVQLGTVEDWVIVNRAGMDHPFHLHTNSFQIISRNGQPEPFRAWKDVVNVRAYETVRIRIPFRDFVGKTVYHCHILDHEDQGMMGIVAII